MDIIGTSNLSTELQDLYLQNKELMSQVVFLEGENRFFHNLLNKQQLDAEKRHTVAQLEIINENMKGLEAHTANLKNLVIQHKHLLEFILKDTKRPIGIALLNEQNAIIVNIKSLFQENKSLKMLLTDLIEHTDKSLLKDIETKL